MTAFFRTINDNFIINESLSKLQAYHEPVITDLGLQEALSPKFLHVTDIINFDELANNFVTLIPTGDVLELTQIVKRGGTLKEQLAETVDLSDTITSNRKIINVSDNIAFSDVITNNRPIFININDDFKQLITDEFVVAEPVIIDLRDSVSLTIIINISITQTLSLSDTAYKVFPFSILQPIEFTETIERFPWGEAEDYIRLLDTVSYYKGTDILQNISFTQVVVSDLIGIAAVSSNLVLNDRVSYFRI